MVFVARFKLQRPKSTCLAAYAGLHQSPAWTCAKKLFCFTSNHTKPSHLTRGRTDGPYRHRSFYSYNMLLQTGQPTIHDPYNHSQQRYNFPPHYGQTSVRVFLFSFSTMYAYLGAYFVLSHQHTYISSKVNSSCCCYTSCYYLYHKVQ